jgi:hypothetical protein
VKTEFGLRRGRVRRRRLKVEERSESVVFREREVTLLSSRNLLTI